MKPVLLLGGLGLLGLAPVVAGLAVAARPLARWVAGLAAALAMMAVLLLAFLPMDDSYRADGTSNWDAYDVELVALPAALAMLVASAWLLRNRDSRAAGAFGPVASALGALACIATVVLTAN